MLEAVSLVCLRRAGAGPYKAADASAEVAGELGDRWPAVRDAVAMDGVAAQVRSFLKRAARLNPDQYVIPGFERAPAVIVIGNRPAATVRCTIEEARIFLKWQESRLKGTLVRCKEEEAATRELRRLVRAAAPYCITPGMTIEDGLVDRAKSLESKRARHNREIASAGGRAKNRRT